MNGKVYDKGYGALLDVLEAMVDDAEADPKKWDEEYAEHAVLSCLDRMTGAGPARPAAHSVDRYLALVVRARPFSSEDVPLPGRSHTDAEIAALLESGDYDDLTAAEFRAKFPRREDQ